jgi:hypothetical protein
VLTALRALGAQHLPPLEEATMLLGAPAPLGAPPLRSYLRLPGQARAALDVRAEALARAHGIEVRSRTSLAPPWPAPSATDRGDCVLIANLAYGQERPGRRGTWGWHALHPATYATGGHSVIFAGVLPGGGRVVIDPNLPAAQRWSSAGWTVTTTRIRRLGA